MTICGKLRADVLFDTPPAIFRNFSQILAAFRKFAQVPHLPKTFRKFRSIVVTQTLEKLGLAESFIDLDKFMYPPQISPRRTTLRELLES